MASSNLFNPQGVWRERCQIESEIQFAQRNLDRATHQAKCARKNNGIIARQQEKEKNLRVIKRHLDLVSTEKSSKTSKNRRNLELVPRPHAKKHREQNEAMQAFQFVSVCALAVTGAMAHCDIDTKSSDEVTVYFRRNNALLKVNVARIVNLDNLKKQLSKKLNLPIPGYGHMTRNDSYLKDNDILRNGDKLAFTCHGRGGARDFSIVWFSSKTHIAAPILLKEEDYEGPSKAMYVACMAFVRKTRQKATHVILAEWVKTGFQVQGDKVQYYGYFDNPKQQWTCEVINGKLGNICDEEGKPVHVVHFDQIDRILNVNDDCAEVLLKQSGITIQMQLHCLRTPGFFHVNGDPESDYSYIDFAGKSTGETSQEVYTRLQQQLVRLDSVASKSIDSEASKFILIQIIRNDSSDAKYNCVYRAKNGGTRKRQPFLESEFEEKFGQQGVELLEAFKKKQQGAHKKHTAAKPIASPEPHLRAKIIEIEAHEQDPDEFTVWYEFEDRRRLKMSTIVTSTDGNIDLPLLVDYVWDDNSRKKFREFWTEHKQANKPAVIEICESENDTEEPQKHPASPDSNTPDGAAREAVKHDPPNDDFDRSRLLALFESENPAKVNDIEAIMAKRPRGEHRVFMWRELSIKYPRFFRKHRGFPAILPKAQVAKEASNEKSPTPSVHETLSMQVDLIAKSENANKQAKRSGSVTPLTSPSNFNQGDNEDDGSGPESELLVRPHGSPDQATPVDVNLDQMQGHKQENGNNGLHLLCVDMISEDNERKCLATYIHWDQMYNIVIPDTDDEEERKKYFRCFNQYSVFLALHKADKWCFDLFWWHWPRILEEILTDQNEFLLEYNPNELLGKTRLVVTVSSGRKEATQELWARDIVWTCDRESLVTLKNYLSARFDNGSEEQKKVIEDYVALVSKIWGEEIAKALMDKTLPPRQPRIRLPPVGLDPNGRHRSLQNRHREGDPTYFGSVSGPNSRLASPQSQLAFDEDPHFALSGETFPGVIHAKTILRVVHDRRDFASKYEQLTDNQSIQHMELKVELRNMDGNKQILFLPMTQIVKDFDEPSVEKVYNWLQRTLSLSMNATREFEKYVRKVRAFESFQPDSQSHDSEVDGNQHISDPEDGDNAQMAEPVPLNGTALDDMSSTQLQQIRAELQKEKQAEMQRITDEYGGKNHLVSNVLRKRKDRKKFDAQKKLKKSIHKALKREHSKRITVMKKRYEKRQQKLAATNIQAVARSTVNRMQYQKNLPKWKEMQAAMKLAMAKKRAAEEAELKAQEADRDAKRTKREAEEAERDANRKLSEFRVR